MDKKKITVCKNDFVDAKDNETCLVWAKEFLEKDTPLSEEIAEIEGAIKNGEIWQAGAENNMERDMFGDNLINLNAYLVWLYALRSMDQEIEAVPMMTQ